LQAWLDEGKIRDFRVVQEQPRDPQYIPLTSSDAIPPLPRLLNAAHDESEPDPDETLRTVNEAHQCSGKVSGLVSNTTNTTQTRHRARSSLQNPSPSIPAQLLPLRRRFNRYECLLALRERSRGVPSPSTRRTLSPEPNERRTRLFFVDFARKKKQRRGAQVAQNEAMRGSDTARIDEGSY
jgi:hypothetical protein